MSRMIQVRNVPNRLHRELTKRARAEGKTLTRFIEDVLEREVALPSAGEVSARVRGRGAVDLGGPAAELLRAEREARGS